MGSIGDMNYKKNPHLAPSEQTITSTPDICSFPREPDDEFLILACDGIWDVLSSQDAVDFVKARLESRLSQGRPLSSICEEMMDFCISPDLQATQGIGGDNMTAVIVLLNGQDH